MDDRLINRVNALISEGIALRDDPRSEAFWDDEIENELDTLIEVSDLFELNGSTASSKFMEMKIFSYDTFKDFASGHSLKASKIYNKSGTRTRNIRTSSKKVNCPLCGTLMREDTGNNMICTSPKCKNVVPISAINTGHNLVSKSKHVSDKLAILTGIKKPPVCVDNITPQITEWLLNMTHLRDYLNYEGEEAKTRFLENYAEVLYDLQRNSSEESRRIREKMDIVYVYNEFGDLTLNLEASDIPPEPKFAFTFPEYRLIIAEFSLLLNECSRLYESKYISSSINSMEKDDMVNLFTAYRNEFPNTIPTAEDTFEYEGVNYNIGAFLNYIRLTRGNPETEHFVENLEPVFGIGSSKSPILCIPGLTFSFIDLAIKFEKKEKIVPMRYTFTENYGYLIHLVFGIPQTMISPNDRAEIINIIAKFDEYAATLTDLEQGNSKIYTAKLHLIFKMAYFSKYRELIRYLPLKPGDTSGKIDSVWKQFKTESEYAERLAIYDEFDGTMDKKE